MRKMQINDRIVADGHAHFAKVFIDIDGDTSEESEFAFIVVAERDDGKFVNFNLEDLIFKASDA